MTHNEFCCSRPSSECVEGACVICKKAFEAGLKAKSIPSYEKCIDDMGGVTSEPVTSRSSAVIGAKRMYDYITIHHNT